MRAQICSLFSEDGTPVVGAKRLVISRRTGNGRTQFCSARITEAQFVDRRYLARILHELRKQMMMHE